MRRPRVALATRADLPAFGHEEIRLVTAALAEEGVDAAPVVWTSGDDLSRFDACLVRSTWDYPERLPEFRAWIDAASRATELWNAPAALEWNLHKGYLLQLAAKGVAIPPTELVRGSADLASIMDARGWTRVVVKPAVGASGTGSMRVAREDAASGQKHLDDLLARGDAIVQSYLPSIETHGEISIFAFGGELAHAVRKRPKRGDHRVQEHYGGTHAPASPTLAEAELARRALAAAPRDLLYARLDIVATIEGAPALMELEAIEPYLYLESVEEAAPYARAVAEALGRRTGPHLGERFMPRTTLDGR